MLFICTTISASAANIQDRELVPIGEIDYPAAPPEPKGIMQFTITGSGSANFVSIATGQADKTHKLNIKAQGKYNVDDARALITASYSPTITARSTSDTAGHTHHRIWYNPNYTATHSISSNKKTVTFKVSQYAELYSDAVAFVPLQKATATATFSKTLK